MPNPQEVLEYLESQKKTPETPEKNIGPGGAHKVETEKISNDGRTFNFTELEPGLITIPVKEHNSLIRVSERYRLIENYILNNEFCSNDTLRAMIGIFKRME